MSLLRILTALLCSVGCAGCGSTAAYQELQRSYQELDAKYEAALAQAGSGQQLNLDTHQMRRLDGFVNYRPQFCNGGMCLEIVSARSYPIGNVRVNDAPVPLRRSSQSEPPRPPLFGARPPPRIDGPYLGPRDRAYIRLVVPGRYIVRGDVLDAVEGPRGFLPPTGAVLERCEVTVDVPSANALANGVAMVVFGDFNCDTVRPTTARK